MSQTVASASSVVFALPREDGLARVEGQVIEVEGGIAAVAVPTEASGLLTHEDVYLSYLPLAHSMEQGILGACAIWGL